MHNATVNKELTIAIEEECARQTLVSILHLRVTESKPYLLNLTFCKETVDDFDIRAQESHILQSRF